MKLICDEPAEHLNNINSLRNGSNTGDPPPPSTTTTHQQLPQLHNQHYKYHPLTKNGSSDSNNNSNNNTGSDKELLLYGPHLQLSEYTTDYATTTAEEDTEDELKAPLLSVNQRLNEIYVSGGGVDQLQQQRRTRQIQQQQQQRSEWAATNEANDYRSQLTDYSPVRRPRHKFCPFPSRRDINHRLSIWDGEVGLLEVDAISTTSETLGAGQQQQQQSNQQQSWESGSSAAERLLRRAGVAQVRRALAEIGAQCDSAAAQGTVTQTTGEVQVTPGFQLSSKYILHTVCPAFSEKLRPAATQTTLFSCYRNVLTKAVDLGLKSVALCSVYSAQKNFPTDIRAHIALRTVRRFLESHPDFRVVLCVDKAERSLYNILAPLYFPGSKAEEEVAVWHLPADIGGTNGEPVDPERQIRIIQNPQHDDAMNRADDDSDQSPHDLEGGNADLEYGTVLLNLQNHQSFTQMQGDLDRQRLLGDRPRAGVYESVIEDGLEGLEHQVRYEKLLKRAQTEDLREVSGIGCLYQSGVDRLGRPVIVFCGKWFPAQNVNLEKALLYLIYLLDPIVNGDYVITYFHTLTSSSNYPSLHWLKDVYTVLPYKYKKHLKAFYIVHPTIWTKMVTWWFTTFMAPAIKAKVHSLPGVEHLYSAISKDQLEIPAYITEYDMTVNGLHYFQPTGPTTTS